MSEKIIINDDRKIEGDLFDQYLIEVNSYEKFKSRRIKWLDRWIAVMAVGSFMALIIMFIIK